MLKKTITYENPFTQEQVTEDHYFHISKADLVEMEMEEHGATYVKDGETLKGMRAKLQKIIDAQDGKAIIAELKDIIRRSYGRKEGDRFRKSPEIWDEFSSTEAFSQLLFDLCTDPKAATDFINGIAPHNLEQIASEVEAQVKKAQEAAEENGGGVKDPTGLTEETVDGTARDRAQVLAQASPEIPVTLTRDEMTEMDKHTLQSGLVDGRYKLS